MLHNCCCELLMRVTTCNYPRRNYDLIDPLIKYPYADRFLPLTAGKIVEIDTLYSDAIVLVSFRNIDTIDIAVC